jgi:hypothetical protein
MSTAWLDVGRRGEGEEEGPEDWETDAHFIRCVVAAFWYLWSQGEIDVFSGMEAVPVDKSE